MSRNVHSLKDNTCKYSIILWKHSYKWFQFHISLRTATSQQKLSKGALPCSCVLFLAVQSSPLGHGHTDDASSPSAGMWELDVMLMILYYSRTLWALKKCRNFEEYGFIKKPALLVLSVSQLIFSLPSLCVLYAQSKWQTRPFSILSSCFKKLLGIWKLKASGSAGWKKKVVLHDPHYIPRLLLAQLLWNILKVVALEVKDLFHFFKNCIIVPICDNFLCSPEDKKEKVVVKKSFKSSVLDLALMPLYGFLG